MALKLTTYGGAETVTGSNFLIESEGAKILVDCGIEQGRDFVAAEMYAPFPFPVAEIDAVIVTHAHLDHVGRLPKLMREGFKGTVYMTPPTSDLAKLILLDSSHILADTARRQHATTLYDDNDIEALFARVKTIPYHEETEVAPGLSVYLRNTGHILGSASVRIRASDGTTLALTGDIGNSPSPLLPDSEPIPDASVILMESVYGDRKNEEKGDRVALLKDMLKRAISRGGTILMPAFSMERTQLMLYEIGKLMDAGDLPKFPIFLDSPLAIRVTDVYEKYGAEYFKPATEDELGHRELFKLPLLTETLSPNDSEKIREAANPKLIIAGAGMSHGGRIGKWEQRYLPDVTTTLIMVGYQAPGSPGRMLEAGAKKVRIEDMDVPVRAKIETLHGWSGHADRDGLLEFAQSCLPQTKTFLVGLGEPESARFLAQRIHDYLGVPAIVPTKGQSFVIGADGKVS